MGEIHFQVPGGCLVLEGEPYQLTADDYEGSFAERFIKCGWKVVRVEPSRTEAERGA